MAKIVNISEIHPTLGFTEFDILEKYRKSFNESELGKLHSVFPFECMAKAAGLSDRRLGRRNIFSPSAKIALMVLKAYTGFSDIFILAVPDHWLRIHRCRSIPDNITDCRCGCGDFYHQKSGWAGSYYGWSEENKRWRTAI